AKKISSRSCDRRHQPVSSRWFPDVPTERNHATTNFSSGFFSYHEHECHCCGGRRGHVSGQLGLRATALCPETEQTASPRILLEPGLDACSPPLRVWSDRGIRGEKYTGALQGLRIDGLPVGRRGRSFIDAAGNG